MPAQTYVVPVKSFRISVTSGNDSRDGSTYSDEVKTLLNSTITTRLERSWANTPQFKAKRSSGARLPTNPYLYSKVTVGTSPGYYTLGPYKTGIGTETISISITPYSVVGVSPPPFTIETTSVNQELISKARGNNWNVGIFGAELGKTASMVAQRATHLAHMANTLRRGDLFGFFRLFHRSVRSPNNITRHMSRFKDNYKLSPAQAAGNAWLEYRYGWRPFLKDVRDATNTLLDAASRPRDTEISVSARRVREAATTQKNVVLFDDVSFRITGEILEVIEESLRVKWRFAPSSLDMPASFGLLNPLEVAWELLPFSFVADWFLPIGAYLSAMDVPLRFEHRGGSVGQRALNKSTFLAKTVSPANATITGFSGRGSALSLSRTGLLIAPSIELMGKFDLSSSQVTSSIALLQQQLMRLKR